MKIVLKQKSFKHGWFYHYRIHEPKVQDLCKENHTTLKNYLYQVFENCPDSYFHNGPRSSSLKIDVGASMAEYSCHETSILADQSRNMEYKTAHSKVQMFMLKFDKKTIGVEVPIWLEPCEMSEVNTIFETELPLTGHIDALRIEDDKIWIWDYKPRAEREKFAHTQVYFYAYMLSKRTNIPLCNFRCGYFDEKVAYTFDPNEISSESLKSVSQVKKSIKLVEKMKDDKPSC